MIEGRNIVKKFDGKILFKDLNFMIEDGEFVCFSGVSGSGKTTLLNIIGLIEPVDSGELLIDGKRYKSRRQKLAYYRTKVGFLFQNFALIENKTVKENLELIRKDDRTEYDMKEVLDLVGLADKIESKIYTLSGGEQQRVSIARALAKNPKLLLCDEPTGALDYQTGKAILKLLQDTCRERGMTVIVITHNSALTPMADRVIKIKNGKVSRMTENAHPTPVEEIEW